MNNAERIERYVIDELARGRRSSVASDEDLVEAGVLDSLSIEHLIRWIEESFAVEVRDEDIVPESFRTLRGICELVERLVAGSSRVA